ncbi:hypothetical protein, partial [Aequoribacter fuscus]|uniref:hypothetical protein n=1 Tax=Aequoribacter fuscus TaxID=2518989 RepID=UPI0005930A51
LKLKLKLKLKFEFEFEFELEFKQPQSAEWGHTQPKLIAKLRPDQHDIAYDDERLKKRDRDQQWLRDSSDSTATQNR